MRLKEPLALVLGLAAAPVGSSHAASHPGLFFVDIADSAGVQAPTWCGRPEKPHILESGGTGLALFDYDGDGDLDIYLVNGWRLEGHEVAEKGQNLLYRNAGDGSFDNVSTAAGVADDGWGCGVAVGDADGDGLEDLFVANFGADLLYRNNGDGSFSSLPDAPSIDGWSTGAAFFDADGDGDQDLYVAAYINCTLEEVLHAEPELDWQGMKVMLGPFGLEGKANRFFENLGSGRFRDATEAAGLEDKGLYYSFAVAALDLNGDGSMDLYVANDSNPNYLYRNQGNGRFQEMGLWSGAALDESGFAQAGMGFAAGDVDNDGDSDFLVTNFSQDVSTLYLNLGELVFEDATRRMGLREATYQPLSWGTSLSDFDLDGDLDLFVANGHIYPQADRVRERGFSYAQHNLLLKQEAGGFEDVSPRAGPGLAVVESSRGVATGDVDGDGDLDLVVANVDAPPTLLRNDSNYGGRWLLVDAPQALEARVRVGTRHWTRQRVEGGSYLSVDDHRFHFGLGAADGIDELILRWPGGGRTILKDLGAGRRLRIQNPALHRADGEVRRRDSRAAGPAR